MVGSLGCAADNGGCLAVGVIAETAYSFLGICCIAIMDVEGCHDVCGSCAGGLHMAMLIVDGPIIDIE